MIKAPSSLQDLRRSLYLKAKAEQTGRFWGLYVHVGKRETLQEAYQMAKRNDGAPGSDGETLEAIEEGGGESFLKQIDDELSRRLINSCGCGKRKFRRTGAPRSAFSPFLPFATAWSREPSSSSWSRSWKLTFNRGRMDTDRSGRLRKRYSKWTKRFWKGRPESSILISEPTSTAFSITGCWRR